jgi:hypothetical protein
MDSDLRLPERPRTEGDGGSVRQVLCQLAIVFDRAGQVGIAEQHLGSSRLQNSVPDAVTFTTIARILKDAKGRRRFERRYLTLHGLECVIRRSIVDHEDLRIQLPVENKLPDPAKRRNNPRRFVESRYYDREARHAQSRNV